MKSIARFVTRFSALTLIISTVLVALSAIFGLQVFGNLQAGGYDDPNSDSAKVYKTLENTFGQRVPEVIMIVDFKQSADSDAAVALATKLSKDLNSLDGVSWVDSYYTKNRPDSLKSKNGHEVYFFVHLDSDSPSNSTTKKIMSDFDGDYHSARIYVAGWTAITSEINGTISKDLALAESFAVPVTILLLLFVFGSVVAAGLPFIVAMISIIGSFFTLWLVSQSTDVSVFGVNLVTGLGLGLGIDYALLMVNRFREERANGNSVEQATIDTITSAGRTVLFSGLTVATVMVGMSFFPQYFLQTFAYAGISVVLFAVVASLFALPAIFNLLGDKINLGKLKIGRSTETRDHGSWAKVAKFVMRRPIAVLVVIMLGLGGLASLGSSVVFGQVDDRILPATDSVVLASNEIRNNFEGREASPVEVIVTGATQSEIAKYSEELSNLKHIVRVQSTAGLTMNGITDTNRVGLFSSYKHDDEQRIVAVTDIDSRSIDGYNLVQAIRKLSPIGSKVLIGGSSAVYTDSLLGISNNVGFALAWIIVSTLLLLFFFTGSVVLPIKAVILNLLSLSATLGFITWVFQYGNLQWLTGPFQVTGTIDSSSMVLVAIVAFGLSMDYELFLLSRIKEQHDAGKGTIESVSIGLQRSGRLITTAALVLAFSFSAFITSNVSIMKMLGLGVAFAILLDAVIVRALLVPALMRLFGELNWWAPKSLKTIYAKLGLAH